MLGLKGATTILRKDAEFLGLTFTQLIDDIIANGTGPYPLRVVEAFHVYKREVLDFLHAES